MADITITERASQLSDYRTIRYRTGFQRVQRTLVLLAQEAKRGEWLPPTLEIPYESCRSAEEVAALQVAVAAAAAKWDEWNADAGILVVEANAATVAKKEQFARVGALLQKFRETKNPAPDESRIDLVVEIAEDGAWSLTLSRTRHGNTIASFFYTETLDAIERGIAHLQMVEQEVFWDSWRLGAVFASLIEAMKEAT